MRRIFLTLCAVLICFRFSIAQEKDTHAKNALHVSPQGKEDDIRGAQDALIAAYIHRDTAALDRILAGEYTFINDDAGGVVNKKQILDSFKAGGDREITSYTRQDDQVRMYGDVAVLTYRYQSTETYKGRENGGDFRVTRIFVKRDGRWQTVGGQETRVSGSEPSASLPRTKTAAEIVAASRSTDEHTLLELEKEWARSTGNPDRIAGFIAENLTQDYQYTAPDGTVLSKSDLVTRSQHDTEGIAIAEDMQVRVHSDTAVVTGTWTQGSRHLRFTDTFIRRGTKWLCLAGQDNAAK